MIIIIFYLFILFYFIFFFLGGGGGGVTRLDGLYPQAYDLISIFSIFMEVSNIWLERIEYRKTFRPLKWGSFG